MAPMNPLASLPSSLFLPPTSAEDLSAKFELARETLCNLEKHARLLSDQLQHSRQESDRKEASAREEVVTLRREAKKAELRAERMRLTADAAQRQVLHRAKSRLPASDAWRSQTC